MSQTQSPGPGASPWPGPGEQRLRQSLQRRQQRARKEDPCPYDDDWGWWMEQRLGRLETQIKWLITLAAAALAAEVIRVALAAWGLAPAP